MSYLKIANNKIVVVDDSSITVNGDYICSATGEETITIDYLSQQAKKCYTNISVINEFNEQHQAEEVSWHFESNYNPTGTGKSELTITFKNPTGNDSYLGYDYRCLITDGGKIYAGPDSLTKAVEVGTIKGTGMFVNAAISYRPFLTALRPEDYAHGNVIAVVYTVNTTGGVSTDLVYNIFYFPLSAGNKIRVNTLECLVVGNLSAPYGGFGGTASGTSPESMHYYQVKLEDWSMEKVSSSSIAATHLSTKITASSTVKGLKRTNKPLNNQVAIDKLSLIDENGEVYSFNLDALKFAGLIERAPRS